MSKENGHWYKRDGTPCYEVPRAKGDGMRATTLADARKMDLLPSVTTICRVLNAPALNEWRCRNAAMAVATTPRLADEPLDAFVERCLNVDAESESDAAKQLGTDIHDAVECLLTDKPFHPKFDTFVSAACAKVWEFGKLVAAEKVVCSNDYAGKVDCIVEGNSIYVLDFKTTKAKKLPTKSYSEHRLQLAAYANALGNTGDKKIITANIYISTINAGEISVCENQNWQTDFDMFQKVKALWYWQNDFQTK